MSRLQSLKYRIVALGVLLIVAGIVARYFIALPIAQDLLRDLVAAQQLSIASYVARDVDHSIETRRALVGELVATLPPALLHEPDELASWIRQRQHVNPLFNRGLLVLGPDGRLLAGYPVLPGRDRADFANSEWFRAALLADAAVTSTPRRGDAGGEPILVMAASVRDAAGHAVAVVVGVVALDAPGFLAHLQQTRLGTSGGFLLISPADQLFVGASDPAMVLQPTPPTGVNPLHDRAMVGYRGTGITHNAQGIEELAAIVSVPSAGWFVVARMPTAEAFGPIDVLRNVVLKASLVIMAAMAAILMLLLPIILRPLTDAAQAMREIAEGKRELAPVPVMRRDEVGVLLLSFNLLVTKLREKDTELRNTMQRLDQLAATDALTGAWNRRHFDEMLESELDRFRRYGHPLSLLLLDLDLFKAVNDTHGHAEGDRVLREVAECIRGALRKSDSMARWGGEEFTVLMPETALANAAELAERVRASIAAHRFEGLGTVTASIGVAEFAASESQAQWLARTDSALYRAKRAGRNRVEVDSLRGTPTLTASREAGLVQLVWRDQFRSGNQMLDAQHRALFDDSNRLLAAILSAASAEEIAAAIDELMRDMARHFKDEEGILLAVGYPDVDAHAALHAELINNASELVDRFRAGTLDIGSLFQFLASDFVARHILSADRAFFPHLNRPSGEPASLETQYP